MSKNIYTRFGFHVVNFMLLVLLGMPTLQAQSGIAGAAITQAFTDAEIKERLATMEGCMPLKFTPAVRSYVRTYVMKKPEKAKTMLGNRLTYFDLFEQKLKEHGLPDDLKYLAVVESALNPVAVSRSGARGLWQFMPATGKEYNLRITSLFDQRSDPVRSTDAACRYLKRLYKSYGDWALALAAYNSGPGNVNKAIRRSHSRNFWKVKNYLPRETRAYVPAFIAASYICTFYAAHNITPNYPEMDMQLTSYLKIYESMEFAEISAITGLSVKTISALNPSYKKQRVPSSTSGNFVILPFRVMNTFVNALNKKGTRMYTADFENRVFAAPSKESAQPYTASSYYISNDDHISRIASSLSCNDEHLCAWNDLKNPYVKAGTFLTVWRPVLSNALSSFSMPAPEMKASRKENSKISQPVHKPYRKPNQATETLNSGELIALPTQKLKIEDKDIPKGYLYHIIRRNESLMEVAEKYDVDIESIMDLNPNAKVKVGTRLKIKERE